jgi:hypothetical protein
MTRVSARAPAPRQRGRSPFARRNGPFYVLEPFDSFSPAAHQGYEGGTVVSRVHREVLREAMSAEGFLPNRMEWWHWDLPDAGSYPVLDVPLAASNDAGN